LFNLLGRNPRDGENLDHYLNNHIHHFRGRRDLCVDLETPEKTLDALKNIDECIIVSPNILGCL
jgi:hypothetical protein